MRYQILLLGLWIVVLPALAAPPQVTKLAAPTLQPNAAVTLVFEGADLGPNPRLYLPVPIAAQTVKDGATAAKVQIEVKLEQVAPGIYPLWFGSDKGISAPVGIEIDDLPQQPFGPRIDKLPICLSGTLSGSATLTTALEGKKGQRLVVEVEARRLGSAISPVVKLYDARRVLVDWARGQPALDGDARLAVKLPADGPYTIELHDLQFKAANPNRFRLRVGDLQFADLAYPLAGQRGGKASFQLVGSVPDSTRVEADLAGLPGGAWLRLPRVPGLAGSPPAILVSDMPEVLEAEQPPGKIQEVAFPAGINGRLLKPREEDQYRIPVQAGQKLRFELLAERASTPVDGVLILRNEKGMQLARGDDQPATLDPALEYTVPEGTAAVIAAVSDLHGEGGPTYLYRLAVTQAGTPDFTLALTEDRLLVPRAAAAVFRVRAARAGYNGPIKLTLGSLPPGVAVSGDEIPAGATDALLTLAAPDSAALGQAVIQIIGSSSEPNLVRLALPPETPFTRAQPWVRGQLGVAVIEPSPLTIAWETPPEDRLPAGGKVSAKVKVARAADLKGVVRLSLLTSQVAPKGKDNKDDVARTLRFEAAPMLAADQTAEFKIVVPADLPAMPYDLAVRAELMAPDNKTVQLQATTPARRALAGK